MAMKKTSASSNTACEEGCVAVSSHTRPKRREPLDISTHPPTPTINGRLSRAFPGPGGCCRIAEVWSLLLARAQSEPAKVTSEGEKWYRFS